MWITDHDWRAFCLEMVLEFASLLSNLASSRNGDDFAVNLEHAAQTKADLHAANPFGRAHKLLRLVAHVNQSLS